MTSADYIVVGSGITGATIARLLADSGREVLVLERRGAVSGNVHDSVHPSGIRFSTYGPHYFRTSSRRIWDFVKRFGSFYRHEATVRTYVDRQYRNWPILAAELQESSGNNWKPAFAGVARNFEEACLSVMPSNIYEKFIKGYTEKQWGTSARNLEPALARRITIRLQSRDTRLVGHRYQGLPEDGYTALVHRMLDKIPVLLQTDYLNSRDLFKHNKLLFFTGPIDELFSFQFGRLKYRGQQRQHEFHAAGPFIQPCEQVNNPNPRCGKHIRTIEWKHLMQPHKRVEIPGTLLTREIPFTPSDPDDYEYPFPDVANKILYEAYQKQADLYDTIVCCGRLGCYRYYDMDQAIAAAMKLIANKVLRTSPAAALHNVA